MVADDELHEAPLLPDELVDSEPLTAPDTPPDRMFELGDEVINDREMDMTRVDEVVAQARPRCGRSATSTTIGTTWLLARSCGLWAGGSRPAMR